MLLGKCWSACRPMHRLLKALRMHCGGQQETMQHVHEIISRHLTGACNPGVPLQPQNPAALLGACGCLRVLQVRLTP